MTLRRVLLCTAGLVWMGLAVGWAVTSAWAQQAPAAVAVAAPDYAQAANWVCRPGAEDVCTTGLDAAAVAGDGTRTPLPPFQAAADPEIDCFYVYPTVSREQGELSDLQQSPEVVAVVKAQAGRLSSRCRVFAPVYRQVTIRHLQEKLAGTGVDPIEDAQVPLEDVEAAWNWYLQHENHGRGVVLVGHSQGTILLQRMMVKDVDGKLAQRLMVSAFLAGDPSLAVPRGKVVGGTFAHIPVCGAAAQTGCVYVWGSYLAADTATQVFGRPRRDGMVSACVNPAAPGGGIELLKSFYPNGRNPAAGDAAWIEAVGLMSGECKASAAGNGFRVTVQPGPGAALLGMLLQRSALPAGWGVHVMDIALVQGNMLDVLDAEIASWRGSR